MYLWICSLTCYPAKMFLECGVIIKYPNKTPMKNRKEEIARNNLAFFLSLSYKAGRMNFHNSHKIKGKAMIKPAVIAVQMWAFSWPDITRL